MTRYRGNEMVEPGLYINVRGYSIESIDRATALPGTSETVYRRVPILAMFAVAPLLGLAFVVFLPFIGFAMVGKLLAGKALELTVETGRAAARVLRPNWEPSLAFLSRSKRAKQAPPAPVADPWAEDVEKKLGRPNGDAS